MTFPALSAFRPLKNRFGILYFLSPAFLLQSLAVRLVLFVKALPGMTEDPIVLFKMVVVGFLYDSITFSYFAFPSRCSSWFCLSESVGTVLSASRSSSIRKSILKPLSLTAQMEASAIRSRRTRTSPTR